MKKILILATAFIMTASLAFASTGKNCCKQGETCSKACTEMCEKYGCKDGKCTKECKKACKAEGKTECKKGTCCKGKITDN